MTTQAVMSPDVKAGLGSCLPVPLSSAKPLSLRNRISRAARRRGPLGVVSQPTKPVAAALPRATKNPVDATEHASTMLVREPLPEGGKDPRWRALLKVTAQIANEPELVWEFIEDWGGHEREDIREAIAACVLEPLLELHCNDYLELVIERAIADSGFADLFLRCERFGAAALPENATRMEATKRILLEKFFA